VSSDDPGGWRNRQDAHAPRASLHPSERGRWAYAYDLDPIETACPHCTLVCQDGTWVHDGACPAAARPGRTA
jgi:hypothetical protein